jgi:hypothetical protein
MARILFVTGSAGGVGVETLQHRGTLQKSNGDSCDVLNSSLMRAGTISHRVTNCTTSFLRTGLMLFQTRTTSPCRAF